MALKEAKSNPAARMTIKKICHRLLLGANPAPYNEFLYSKYKMLRIGIVFMEICFITNDSVCTADRIRRVLGSLASHSALFFIELFRNVILAAFVRINSRIAG